MTDYSALSIPNGNTPANVSPDRVQVNRQGGVSMTLTNGVVTTTSSMATREIQAPRNSVQNSGTITEARNSWGSVKTGSDITEASIVNIGGIETTIKAAMAAGMVTRNADGSYAVAGGQQAPQDQPQADPNDGMESLGDEAVEASITEIATKAAASDVVGVINALSKGEGIPETAVGRIASQMGLEPGEAMHRAETIRAAFETQALNTIGKSGFEAQDVVAWAWENRPDLMKQAIYKQATERTTKGYDGVVKAYLGGLEKSSPQTILNAKLPSGMTAHQQQDGTIMVTTPQGNFSWSSLLRMGAISVGRG